MPLLLVKLTNRWALLIQEKRTDKVGISHQFLILPISTKQHFFTSLLDKEGENSHVHSPREGLRHPGPASLNTEVASEA